MARFDVFPNPDGSGWLLDLQSDLLNGLNTTIVAPLMPQDQAPTPAQRLNPIFLIDGRRYVLMTQFMAAVPRTILKYPKQNLTDQADEISNAIDMVFLGF